MHVAPDLAWNTVSSARPTAERYPGTRQHAPTQTDLTTLREAGH
jgi:hypothetical protein